MDDQDSVTLYDIDGNVVLQFYRHSGREKVYVQSPTVGSTSISNEKARAIAMFILDTLKIGK